MKKWICMVLSIGMVFSSTGCGSKAKEAPANEPVQLEETENEQVGSSEKDEEQTADINNWFVEMYGDEDGPDWYSDVTDIRIVTVDGKRILSIESANTDESVASSMAMLIWGYDDTIETVYVYDTDGNTLFMN